MLSKPVEDVHFFRQVRVFQLDQLGLDILSNLDNWDELIVIKT